MDDQPGKPPIFNWTDKLEFMRDIHSVAFYSFGDRVLDGPFKGMQIPQFPVWEDGNIGAKLLGTYEHELHQFVEAAIARQPKTIVNVGCAEGYYAIGLARRLPEATVWAFDVNKDSLSQCAEFAAKNSVAERMYFLKGCVEPEELTIDGEPPFLYVIDCEGYELKLVDFEKCPQLSTSDLIVECHDFINKDYSNATVARVIQTHAVTIVRPELMLTRYPVMPGWPLWMRVLLALDKRPDEVKWLVGWSKT